MPEQSLDKSAERLPSLSPQTEFINLITYSTDLAKDFRAMRDSGMLEKISPEFKELWGPNGQQDPKWHPEGDTFEHTCLVLDNLPKNSPLELRLAAIFHDIGKPLTFHDFPSGGIASRGHAAVGANLFKRYIAPTLGLSETQNETIFEVIKWHMYMHDIHDPSLSNASSRKYIFAHPNLDLMRDLQHADALGNGLALNDRLGRSNFNLLDDVLTER